MGDGEVCSCGKKKQNKTTTTTIDGVEKICSARVWMFSQRETAW